MDLFVDIVGADDRYRASGASFVEPSLALAVVQSAALVEGPSRVFHVERARYVVEHCFAEAGIDEHDSVVIVSPVHGVYPSAQEVRLRWFAAGGAARRLVCFPVPAYAMSSTPSRWLS